MTAEAGVPFELAARIERCAQRLAGLDPTLDHARAESQKARLAVLCMEYLSDAGSEEFGQAFTDAARDFRLEEDSGFVQCLEAAYERLREKAQEKAGSDHHGQDEDGEARCDRLAVDEERSDLIAKMAALVGSVVEHTQGTFAARRARFTRVFFTETLTRLVRQETEHGIAPYVHNQQTLLASVDYPLQDVFTLDECRSIRALWETDLDHELVSEVPGWHGSLLPDGKARTWTIPGKLLAAYCGVSESAVSQRRAQYSELLRALAPGDI